MSRGCVIYALYAEDGADPEFFPSRKLARAAFDGITDDGGEPSIKVIRLSLDRADLCAKLNGLEDKGLAETFLRRVGEPE